MRARNDPTPEQRMRRLRRRPESPRDPRYKNNGYWALRDQGYSHSYAKLAFRDEPPELKEHVVSDTSDCDLGELLVPPGSTYQTVKVAQRSFLTEAAIVDAQPRASEYTIPDQTVSGLGLRVRTTGYKSFILHGRHLGPRKLKKVTLGPSNALTLDGARQLARKILFEARMKCGQSDEERELTLKARLEARRDWEHEEE